MNALFIAAKEVVDFMAARRWKFCKTVTIVVLAAG